MNDIEKKQKALGILRWTVRGLGLLFVLPMIAQAYRDGLPNFLDLEPIKQLGYTGLVLIWLSVVLGFFFELIGGILILIGLSAVIISEKNIELGGSFVVFAMIALGYIGVWFKGRQIK